MVAAVDMAAAKATEVMAAAEATATTVMVAAAVKATADILAADRIPTAAEDMTTDTRQVVIFVCDAFGTNVVPMLFANCLVHNLLQGVMDAKRLCVVCLVGDIEISNNCQSS